MEPHPEGDEGDATPTGYAELVREAGSSIPTYSGAEAVERFDDGSVTFVDVRDAPELWQTGKVPQAVHASRGMLEFHVDPESAFAMDAFASGDELVFYCTTGERGVLAAARAREMGVSPVAAIKGGLSAWSNAGGPTETVPAPE